VFDPVEVVHEGADALERNPAVFGQQQLVVHDALELSRAAFADEREDQRRVASVVLEVDQPRAVVDEVHPLAAVDRGPSPAVIRGEDESVSVDIALVRVDELAEQRRP